MLYSIKDYKILFFKHVGHLIYNSSGKIYIVAIHTRSTNSISSYPYFGGMGYAWKTRCSGGCHRPMSYTKNTLSSVKRWQRVFRGCDLLQMRTWKNTLSSVKDHNTFLGVVIFCRSERILHVVIYRWERIFEGVIFAKIKLWILGCHLLKKMTTHRTRCHLQKITS